MYYEYETGICIYVDYQKYCNDLGEKDEQINELQIEIENLKQSNMEHKSVIQEILRLSEEILKNDK